MNGNRDGGIDNPEQQWQGLGLKRSGSCTFFRMKHAPWASYWHSIQCHTPLLALPNLRQMLHVNAPKAGDGVGLGGFKLLQIIALV